jgi:hypothetical protein
MNIEISPKEYWRHMLKHQLSDAELYCQLLVIDGKYDWRLPIINEKVIAYSRYFVKDIKFLYPYDGQLWLVIPVRDI